MDNRERWSDPEEMLRVAIDGLLTQVWTSLPGYVVDYDPSTNSCTVQLGVQGQLASPNENPVTVNYPLLRRVPVIFPRGGGCTLTFPISEGDECWVSFACRAIGGWKQSGGVQPPNASRRHALSDAVCFIGPMSQAKRLGSISATTTQLRSDDGSTYVELDAAGMILNFVAPGGVKFTTPDVLFTGNVTVPNGDVTAGAVSLKNHLTTNVRYGTSLSGKPQQ